MGLPKLSVYNLKKKIKQCSENYAKCAGAKYLFNSLVRAIRDGEPGAGNRRELSSQI